MLLGFIIIGYLRKWPISSNNKLSPISYHFHKDDSTIPYCFFDSLRDDNDGTTSPPPSSTSTTGLICGSFFGSSLDGGTSLLILA